MDNQFEEHFRSFIDDIISVFPEYDERIKKYYQPILNQSDKEEDIKKKKELLDNFIENINQISNDIADKNFNIFEDDPIILQNVSSKLIWKMSPSDETRLNIWKYLQTFCISLININQEKEDVENVLRTIQENGKVADKKTFQNLKKFKKLSEPISLDMLRNKNILTNDNKDNIDELDNILKNSSIGKIAKQVGDDLDIEGLMGKDGGLDNIFQGDTMINIFKNISTRIEDENKNGGNIMEEALNITKSMNGNPLFTSLMSGIGDKLDPNMMGMGMGNPMSGLQTPQNQANENQNNRNIKLNQPKNNNKADLVKEKHGQKTNVTKKDGK